MVIATARLTLTPLRVEDAEEMVGVLGDESLYVFTGGRPPTDDELRDRFRRQVAGSSPDGAEEWRNWIVRQTGGGHAIGYVQATIAEQRADIAWVIGIPWQGRGYATEAVLALVEWLEGRGIMTITAHIHPDHHASASVARRAGLAPGDEMHEGEIVWRKLTGQRTVGLDARQAALVATAWPTFITTPTRR